MLDLKVIVEKLLLKNMIFTCNYNVRLPNYKINLVPPQCQLNSDTVDVNI